jgi:hypothetical protein
MKKSYITLVLISMIILIAVITNPNQERHKEVIKDRIMTYLQKSINIDQAEPKNDWAETGQALGIMLGGALVDRIVDNLISTDNYVLFSRTKITWNGKTKIIGIGAFGNVFITSKLDESLNKGLLEN